MKTKIALILFIGMSMNLTAGSGWVKKRGQSYMKLNQFWVQSNGGYFNSDGIIDPFRRASLFTTSFYTETGLSDNLSFELFLPIYTQNLLSIENERGEEIFSDRLGGIGDVNIGLKQALVQKDIFSMSLTYTLGLPLGAINGGEDGTLFTGDGELNGMLRLDAGVPFGFGKFGGYFNGNLGYNLRGSIFSNEFLYGTELGISAFESRFWLITRLVGVEATQTGTNMDGNPFAGNVNFLNFSVESNFYLNDRVGLSVNYVGNVSGAEVLISPAYNVGVFLDIK